MATRVAPEDDRNGDQVEVADRGRTRIADRVVKRITARAVAEVDRATGVPRQILGVRLGSMGPDTRARVDADVDGGVVTVRVSMAVQWPAPILAVTRQVRGHVAERLQRLTGLRVAQIDIDVPALLTGTEDEGRRVS
jgi:uncharacterized alkaline shock family protein YloU